MANLHDTFIEFDGDIIKLSSIKKAELRTSRNAVRGDIEKYFDGAGIRQCQSAQDILACVNQLTADDYWRAMPAMQANFVKSGSYLDFNGRIKAIIESRLN